MKNQLWFISNFCDAAQLDLALPYCIILYDEGSNAFIKHYDQLVDFKKQNNLDGLGLIFLLIKTESCIVRWCFEHQKSVGNSK